METERTDVAYLGKLRAVSSVFSLVLLVAIVVSSNKVPWALVYASNEINWSVALVLCWLERNRTAVERTS